MAQKHEQRRQKIKKDVTFTSFALARISLHYLKKEDIENDKLPPEHRPGIAEKPSGLSPKEYELLYVETLYTIKHKIGTTTSKHSEGDHDLYTYAQEAFGLLNEDHQRLLEKASEEKVCFPRPLLCARRSNLSLLLATHSHSEHGNRRSERSRTERC